MIMKIGINMNAFGEIDLDCQIRLMQENGFETTFVGCYSTRLEQELEAIHAAGILCESAHAPYDKINDIWKDGVPGDAMLKRLCQGVDLCAAHKIPVLVVHLSAGKPAPRISDIGFHRFSRLALLPL